MSDNQTGQVTRSAADVYDDFFVPALFQQWASRVVDAAALQPGQRVLDVACGTGVVASVAADRVRPGGSVIGLDLNPGMLDVAKRKSPQLEWRQGSAEELPFDDESFDRVVSQFGLMFFEDRRAAIKEMMRVLRRGGNIAVAVWASLETVPGYAAVVALLAKLFGDETAEALRAPFVLGDRRALDQLFREAGVGNAQIVTREGSVRFSSIRSWMYTEIMGWTLADKIDDSQFELLLKEADQALKSFVLPDGSVSFTAAAHIVTATKI